MACPAGAQEGRHLRFPPSCESPLSLGGHGGDGRTETIKERQRIFSTVGEHSVLPFLYLFAVSDTVLLHIWFTLRRARHSSAAQFFCALYRPAPADLDVRHNLSSQVLSVISRLTSCATRACRACVDFPVCVAVMYLILRTGYEKHGRKNPLPYPISERSHVGNLRQIRKQGKGRSSKRKENRRLSFLFAHRRGYGAVPAAGAALSRAPQSAAPR